MPGKRNNLQLGVAVIVMFTLFVACLLFIGGGFLKRPPTTQMTVRFAPGGAVPEIVKGSLVMALGQKVGKVVETAIVEDADPQSPDKLHQQFLEVTARVRADLNLRQDCTVVATGPPLGGKGVIEITNRGASSQTLQPDQPIYGQVTGFQTALDMLTREFDAQNEDSLLALVKVQLDADQKQSLMARIHLSLADINTITERFAREIDSTHDDRMLYKIHVGLDRINAGLALLDGMLQDNRPKIDAALTSIEHAAAVTDTDVIGALARELDDKHPASMIAQAHQAFDRLNQSLDNVTVMTGETRRVVMLNKDRINELVQNVAEAAIVLRAGLKDLSIHPWKIVFKPTDAERRELHIFNVAREFTEAAAHLDDATSRLKSLLDASGGQIPSDDPDLAAIRSDLLSTIERFGEVEQSLWRELKGK